MQEWNFGGRDRVIVAMVALAMINKMRHRGHNHTQEFECCRVIEVWGGVSDRIVFTYILRPLLVMLTISTSWLCTSALILICQKDGGFIEHFKVSNSTVLKGVGTSHLYLAPWDRCNWESPETDRELPGESPLTCTPSKPKDLTIARGVEGNTFEGIVIQQCGVYFRVEVKAWFYRLVFWCCESNLAKQKWANKDRCRSLPAL